MKILLYDSTVAFLTPGGKTTQFIKIQKEISKLGVDIQFARWWDETQADADIIHFFEPNIRLARLAKAKGMKTFFSMIFDYESNKSESDKVKTILKNKLIDIVPRLSGTGAYWKALPMMDKVQFMHAYDQKNALRYFPKYLDPAKTFIIPEAYDPSDMNISRDLDIKDMALPEKYLVSVANISSRKQSLLLARYAKKSHVPVVFLGKATEANEYFAAFNKEIDNKYVFYPGYVSKEWKDCIVSHASGFVLLSLGESGCCAVYEAAAYKIPLLLSDLPWAWGYDSPTDIHFCDFKHEDIAVQQLESFFKFSGKLDHTPFRIYTWSEVAQLYIEQYKELLK